MISLIRFVVTLFVLLTATKALSDEISIAYGLGEAESAVSSAAETKVFEISYRKSIAHAFYWAFEVGGWLDSSGDPNRSSSTFFSTSPGYIVDIGHFEIRNSYGISYVTSPDEYLGGSFPQFHGEVYVGIRDDAGCGFGVKYNHFSSAGIFTPNIGRDFAMLELNKRF